MSAPKAHAGLFRRLTQGLWWDRAWQLTEGCSRVSPACDNCWACQASHMRASNPHPAIADRHAGLTVSRREWTGLVRRRLDNLELPLTVTTPTVWAGWNDLFHEEAANWWPGCGRTAFSEAGFGFLCEAIAVMRECPQHVFVVCTKRPEIAEHLMPLVMARLNMAAPLPNVVGLVTVEGQQWADKRVGHLLRTPWAWRGVSYEPALGPIKFRSIPANLPVIFGEDCWDWFDALTGRGEAPNFDYQKFDEPPAFPHLDWIIMGGETGPGARPMHPAWARQVRDDCARAGVAFMFKQWGEWLPDSQFLTLPGTQEWLDGDGLGSCLTEAPGFTHIHTWPDNTHSFRVGKAKAGRLLDGREHLDMPQIFKPKEAA